MTARHDSRWRRAWIGAGGLLVAAHIGLVLRQFPVSYFTTGRALTSAEFTFHFAQAAEGREFTAGQHRIWGYSPRYMAGYPYGIWNSFGSRGAELSSFVFPWLSLARAFYLWAVATALLPPLLIALSVHLLTRGRGVTLLCLGVSIAVYHLESVLSYLWMSGMIAFPFVTSVAVLYTALLLRSVDSGGRLSPLLAGGCLGVVSWLHPLVLVPAGIATLSVLWVCRGRLGSVRVWVRLALAALAAGLIAWPWLSVLWRFRDLRTEMVNQRLPSGIKYMVMDFFSDRRYLHHFDRRLLFHGLMVLTALGSWVALRRRAPAGVAAFGLTTAGTLMCAYGFPYIGFLNQTEPYRYVVSAVLFALVPATVGARELWALARTAERQGRLLAICLALVILPSLTAYGFDLVYRWRRHATGLDGTREAVLSWLREHPAPHGRVLCEDSLMANLVPCLTGREVIGGSLSDEATLPQSWAGNGMGGAFQPGLWRDRSAAVRLQSHLELLNVVHVVAITPAWIRALEGLGGVYSHAATIGNYTIFAVDPAVATYVWKGESEARTQVEAGTDRIAIRDAPAGRFVIKYHYLRTLRAAEGVVIFPATLLDDPVPYIGIQNLRGLRAFDIWNNRE